MSELLFKTRGNSSPQGKEKVYFCCHSDDFSRYFHEISDEILSIHNCAVWYLKDINAAPDDALLDALLEMQLFVMPVTSNLLCTQNRALDTEFQFAMQHHIPVLPLMMESGLEALFNSKCGDIQFLEKYHKDETAIPYGQKLEIYIKSILLGDTLAEKIRSAFGAYAFLSYRKKDRKYARLLMEIIHRNEFCRDIAIWYDEYLIPGENFNDVIRNSLQKSDLFLLTVTPNIVNEPNYIMSTEYPMAMQAGKPVFSAELVATDHRQLQEKYTGLSACVPVENEKEFSDALLKAVNALALPENDSSPEHLYLIGLAYLGGIDVEVNRQRAVSLITSAAESGYAEAVDKLAHMYQAGAGVARDFEKALIWKRKALALRKEAYSISAGKESAAAYLETALQMIQFLIKLERDTEAGQVSEECLRFLTEIAAEQKPILTPAELADYAYALGISRVTCHGSSEVFNDICDTAIRFAEEAYRLAPTQDNGHTVALVYMNLAVHIRPMFTKNLRTDFGTHYLDKAYAILSTLPQDNEYYARSLLYCHMKLGRHYKSDARFEEDKRKRQAMLDSARNHYSEAIRIVTNLTQEREDLYSLELKTRVYAQCFVLLEQEQQLQVLLERVTVCKRIADVKRSSTAYAELARAYSSLSDWYENHRQYPDAEKFALEACSLWEKAVEIAGHREAQMALAEAFRHAARLFLLQENWSEAECYYEKQLFALLEAGKLSTDRTDKTQKDLFWVHIHIGQCAEKRNDYTKAISHYRQSMASTAYTGLLATSWEQLGAVYEKTQARRAAMEAYEQAITLYEQQGPELLSPQKRAHISDCFHVGRMCAALHKTKDACHWFLKAIEMLENLYEERYSMYQKTFRIGAADNGIGSSLYCLSDAVRKCKTYCDFLGRYNQIGFAQKLINGKKHRILLAMCQEDIAKGLEIAAASDELWVYNHSPFV